jgi:beta-galactosidase GanA
VYRSARSGGSSRQWLEEQYGTLAALNREWGTHFARWKDVMPAHDQRDDDASLSVKTLFLKSICGIGFPRRS